MKETPDDSPFDVEVSLKSVDGSGGTNDFYGATHLSGMVAAAGGAILMAWESYSAIKKSEESVFCYLFWVGSKDYLSDLLHLFM